MRADVIGSETSTSGAPPPGLSLQPGRPRLWGGCRHCCGAIHVPELHLALPSPSGVTAQSPALRRSALSIQPATVSCPLVGGGLGVRPSLRSRVCQMLFAGSLGFSCSAALPHPTGHRSQHGKVLQNLGRAAPSSLFCCCCWEFPQAALPGQENSDFRELPAGLVVKDLVWPLLWLSWTPGLGTCACRREAKSEQRKRSFRRQGGDVVQSRPFNQNLDCSKAEVPEPPFRSSRLDIVKRGPPPSQERPRQKSERPGLGPLASSLQNREMIHLRAWGAS